MQTGSLQYDRKTVFNAFLIFLAAYLVSLALWVRVEGYYGHVIADTASRMVAAVKDVKLEGVADKDGLMRATFSCLRDPNTLIDIRVKTSTYTFNVPLTFAIISALFPVIRRRARAYSEALMILIGIHLVFFLSLELQELTETLIRLGVEPKSVAKLVAYQFLYGFTDNMVIRFEPFLIGFYLITPRFRGEVRR